VVVCGVVVAGWLCVGQVIAPGRAAASPPTPLLASRNEVAGAYAGIGRGPGEGRGRLQQQRSSPAASTENYFSADHSSSRRRRGDGGEALPLADYWRRIESADASVRAAQAVDGAARQAQIDAAIDALSGVDAVSLPDGTVMPVDNSALVAELKGEEPDLARIECELAALAAAGREPRTPAGPADAEQRLREILARPEFQQAEPSALEQELNRLLARLLEGAAGVLFAAPAVVYGLAAIGLLLLGWLVYTLARTMFGPGATGNPVVPAEAGDEDLSAAQALQRAQALASGGDYRTSMRYLYLSSLLFLEEAGRLRYDRTLTNREYLRQVEGQPDLAEPFRVVVNTFDRVWYGFVPVDAQAYETYLGYVQALRRVKAA